MKSATKSDSRTTLAELAKDKLYACREPSCVTLYPMTKITRFFCCRECKRKFKNRQAMRGVQLIEAAMTWRAAPRGKQKKNAPPRKKTNHIGDMAFLVDEWRRQDREARSAAIIKNSMPNEILCNPLEGNI